MTRASPAPLIDMLIALYIFAALISACSIVIVILIANIITLAIVRVPNLQTDKKQYPQILSLVSLTPETVIYDLGCSWGDFLIYAASHGAGKCVGFEIGPLPYLTASLRAMFFSDSKVKIRQQDFFKADLSEADIIYVYLIPTMLPEIFKLVDCLKSGTIVLIKGKPTAGREHADKVIFDEKTGYGIYKYIIK